ncbi:chemotaxis protein CheX [Fontibacillus phaseoli]|uniref:Chemotaxis protein CheX n=1 Tax=Fontibacillus phaseoli TaxID=1416533 RepID=A0A369AYD4_9BACL|nr:chemotaxis protein CheX [Fontibacillus phaseoli]RCX14440.1 chemotaxis protein CheX [Fontibacillus phaseoli]
MQKYDGATDLLNSAIESIKHVFSRPMQVEAPHLFEQTLIQSDIGVLVGIVGDMEGRLIIEGEGRIFSNLSQSMYGMPLEGEMLHSFVGEMANMIAGNTSTLLSNRGRHIDITPPTVMVGKLQMYGFSRGIRVTVHLEAIGPVNTILLLQA